MTEVYLTRQGAWISPSTFPACLLGDVVLTGSCARAVLQQRLQDVCTGRRDATHRLELAIPQKSLHIFVGRLLHLRLLGLKGLLSNLRVALTGAHQIQRSVAA